MLRGGRGRGRGRGRGCGHANNCQECRSELQRLQHTVRTRGAQIGCLYWVVRQLAETLNDSGSPLVTQTPLNILTGPAAQQQVQQFIATLQADAAADAAADANGEDAAGDSSDEGGAAPERFKCQVCWSSYNGGSRRALVMGCGHVICLQCLSSLPRLECPKCRVNIAFVARLFM